MKRSSQKILALTHPPLMSSSPIKIKKSTLNFESTLHSKLCIVNDEKKSTFVTNKVDIGKFNKFRIGLQIEPKKLGCPRMSHSQNNLRSPYGSKIQRFILLKSKVKKTQTSE
jgi:hypothetical protein